MKILTPFKNDSEEFKEFLQMINQMLKEYNRNKSVYISTKYSLSRNEISQIYKLYSDQYFIHITSNHVRYLYIFMSKMNNGDTLMHPSMMETQAYSIASTPLSEGH